MKDEPEHLRELEETKSALAKERSNHRVFVWLVLWALLWLMGSAFSTGDFTRAAIGWVSVAAAWWISGRLLPPLE